MDRGLPSHPQSSLAGGAALVTGAASGIGQATCVSLAERGMNVLACSYSGDEHDVAATVAAGPRASGVLVCSYDDDDGVHGAPAANPAGEIRPFVADVRDGEQLQAACAAARERWGRLDLVVPSAAVLSASPLEQMTDEVWHGLLDVDLGGVMRTMRAGAAALDDGGSIV
jgi:3-oxoacyl-[acyl-carrier protein] reductase